MIEKKPIEFHSLREAANYAKITRPAVYVALKKGKLKGTKVQGKWRLTSADIDEYRANKYNRNMRTINGEPVFDIEKGFFSVFHVAKIMSDLLRTPYSKQRVYYLIYAGKLKCFKKGCAWVIAKDDLLALMQAETGQSLQNTKTLGA